MDAVSWDAGKLFSFHLFLECNGGMFNIKDFLMTEVYMDGHFECDGYLK